jgi:hypothetical protein
LYLLCTSNGIDSGIGIGVSVHVYGRERNVTTSPLPVVEVDEQNPAQSSINLRRFSNKSPRL